MALERNKAGESAARTASDKASLSGSGADEDSDMPVRAQALTMAGKPLQRDQSVTIIDLATIEHR